MLGYEKTRNGFTIFRLTGVVVPVVTFRHAGPLKVHPNEVADALGQSASKPHQKQRGERAKSRTGKHTSSGTGNRKDAQKRDARKMGRAKHGMRKKPNEAVNLRDDQSTGRPKDWEAKRLDDKNTGRNTNGTRGLKKTGRAATGRKKKEEKKRKTGHQKDGTSTLRDEKKTT